MQNASRKIEKPQLTCQSELDILSRVAARIGESLDLNKVLDTALKEVLAAMAIHHGCIYFFDARRASLKIKTEINLSKRFLQKKSVIKTGDGCAGSAAITRKMFAPTKDEQRYVCLESQELLGLDCLAAVPIVAKDTVLGVLELFAPVGRRLTLSERELIEAINHQLAVAIENAAAHADLQRSLDNTKKLLQAAETITATLEFDTILEYLARLATQLTQVSRAAITIYHPESQEFEFAVAPGPDAIKGERRRVEGKALSAVYEKSRTVTLYSLDSLPEASRYPMTASGVKSVLIVPLKFAGTVVGALYLDEPDQKHEFGQAEIELAEGIARHAAAAIENARSFDAAQRALAGAEGLLEAAEIITTVTEPNDMLNQLTWLVRKITGVRRSTFGLFNPVTEELALGMPSMPEIPRGLAQPVVSGPLAEVLFDGKTKNVRDIDLLPDPLRQVLLRHSVQSILLTPLHYGPQVIGLYMLYEPDSGREYSAEQINLIETIAHQAAIALTNARALAEQRRIASTLQQSFVPSRPPEIEGIDFGVGYRSATEAAFVGGDFYDFIGLNGSLVFCIGDVSGQGIDATSLAGVVKSTLRAFAIDNPSPTHAAKRVNKIIYKQTREHQFVTLTYGLLDLKTRVLTYINAGHHPTLVAEREKTWFLPTHNDLPFGIDENSVYHRKSIALQKNSRLILYTDGLIEARKNGAMFGPQGLIKAVNRFKSKNSQGMVDRILAEAQQFAGGRLRDDIAILAINIQ